MIAASDKLGVGIYSPQEASFYARVPLQTLNRWFYGSGQGELVAYPKFGADDERVITFLDFAQALAIRNIRTHYHVPLTKIREAIDRAKTEFGEPYPLARKRTTYLFGADLFIHLGKDEFDYRKLTGNNRKQGVLTKIVEVFMSDMGFDSDGLANEYTAFRHGATEISMNPEVRLGEPIVTTCGYTARALWETCEAEGSIVEAARLLGVADSDVETAYRYLDYLTAA